MELSNTLSAKIEAENGKNYFYKTNPKADVVDSITLTAAAYADKQVLSASSIQYYWLIKDDTIKEDDKQYLPFVGKGWRCINEYHEVDAIGVTGKIQVWDNKKNSISFDKGNDNYEEYFSNYLTQLKCAIKYQNVVAISDEFEILDYNKESFYATVESNVEPKLLILSTDKVELTCQADDRNDLTDKNDYEFKYQWQKKNGEDYEPLEKNTTAILTVKDDGKNATEGQYEMTKGEEVASFRCVVEVYKKGSDELVTTIDSEPVEVTSKVAVAAQLSQATYYKYFIDTDLYLTFQKEADDKNNNWTGDWLVYKKENTETDEQKPPVWEWNEYSVDWTTLSEIDNAAFDVLNKKEINDNECLYYTYRKIWKEVKEGEDPKDLKTENWAEPTRLKIKVGSVEISPQAVAKMNTFNNLTQGGELQGLQTAPDGDVYLNATYINTGTLIVSDTSADNEPVFMADIDTGEVKIAGFTVDKDSIDSLIEERPVHLGTDGLIIGDKLTATYDDNGDLRVSVTGSVSVTGGDLKTQLDGYDEKFIEIDGNIEKIGNRKLYIVYSAAITKPNKPEEIFIEDDTWHISLNAQNDKWQSQRVANAIDEVLNEDQENGWSEVIQISGKDGSSPYELSIDEDFISVPSQSDGLVDNFAYPTPIVTLYQGDEKLSITNKDYFKIDGGSGTLDTENNVLKITIPGFNNESEKDIDRKVIKISYHSVTENHSESNKLAEAMIELVKQKTGIKGEPGEYVYALSTANVIKKDINGNYSPNNFTINLWKKVGAEAPQEITEGSYEFIVSGGTPNPAEGFSTIITPSSNVENITVEIKDSKSNVIDKLNINIVEDGKSVSTTKEFYQWTEKEDSELYEDKWQEGSPLERGEKDFFLWNYEETYIQGNSSSPISETTPIIIYRHSTDGDPGDSFGSIEDYYIYTESNDSSLTLPTSLTDLKGWSKDEGAFSYPNNLYKWNCEAVYKKNGQTGQLEFLHFTKAQFLGEMPKQSWVIYQSGFNQPNQPSAGSVPSGWSENIPESYNYALWACSKVDYALLGNVNWSNPYLHSQEDLTSHYTYTAKIKTYLYDNILNWIKLGNLDTWTIDETPNNAYNNKYITLKVYASDKKKYISILFKQIAVGPNAENPSLNEQQIYGYYIQHIADDGTAGSSITKIEEWYLASGSDNITEAPEDPEAAGWSNSPSNQTLTSTNKYLWNFEIAYNDQGEPTNTTDPAIIGYYTEDGRGIVSITNYYQTTSSNTAPARWEGDTDKADVSTDEQKTIGTLWKKTSADPTTNDNKYLWNFERIEYSKSSQYTYTAPIQVGAHGDPGATGGEGPAGNGIETQTEYYKASSNSNAPSIANITNGTKIPENDGWYTKEDFFKSGGPWDTKAEVSAKPYVWKIIYTAYTNKKKTVTEPVLLSDLDAATNAAAAQISENTDVGVDKTYASVVGKWCALMERTLIDGGTIITGSIGADQIKANSITTDQIKANSITTDKLAANSITTEQLATDAIRSLNYPNGNDTFDKTNPLPNATTGVQVGSTYFPKTGSFLDLEKGNFYTPGIVMKGDIGDLFLRGSLQTAIYPQTYNSFEPNSKFYAVIRPTSVSSRAQGGGEIHTLTFNSVRVQFPAWRILNTKTSTPTILNCPKKIMCYYENNKSFSSKEDFKFLTGTVFNIANGNLYITGTAEFSADTWPSNPIFIRIDNFGFNCSFDYLASDCAVINFQDLPSFAMGARLTIDENGDLLSTQGQLGDFKYKDSALRAGQDHGYDGGFIMNSAGTSGLYSGNTATGTSDNPADTAKDVFLFAGADPIEYPYDKNMNENILNSSLVIKNSGEMRFNRIDGAGTKHTVTIGSYNDNGQFELNSNDGKIPILAGTWDAETLNVTKLSSDSAGIKTLTAKTITGYNTTDPVTFDREIILKETPSSTTTVEYNVSKHKFYFWDYSGEVAEDSNQSITITKSTHKMSKVLGAVVTPKANAYDKNSGLNGYDNFLQDITHIGVYINGTTVKVCVDEGKIKVGFYCLIYGE